MTRQKLVVIGNGMAGCRAIEEILKKDADRFEITVFGAEPRVNYNRIMLSPVLAGEKAFKDIIINDEAWYDENGITLYSGVPLTLIDHSAKFLYAGNVSFIYDRLILATVSDPFRLPLPGIDLDGATL